MYHQTKYKWGRINFRQHTKEWFENFGAQSQIIHQEVGKLKIVDRSPDGRVRPQISDAEDGLQTKMVGAKIVADSRER